MGLGLNIDSQGECLLLEKDYGQDLKTHSSTADAQIGEKVQTKIQKNKAAE